MSMTDLEQRLAALDIDWPATVDVTERVTAVIRTVPEGRSGRPVGPRAWSRPGWSPLRPVLAAGLLLALAAAVLVVSPGARHAVASWLGIGGIEIRVQDDVSKAAAGLDLGEAVTFAEAQRRVDFRLGRLALDADLERLGGGVYLDDLEGTRIVHLIYPAQAGLPEAQPKAIGAVLTQFATPATGSLFTKEALRGESDVTPTSVGGEFAMWVAGPSHMLLPNRDGVPVREEARLSANALLWSAGGVTYRLETALALADAVALAESLR